MQLESLLQSMPQGAASHVTRHVAPSVQVAVVLAAPVIAQVERAQ
jgi:hypothetical protein